ncbi:hypothetical protein LTR66_002447 [Elasticomyces elasticus]|nr:hypothetical protein LTR50_004644 [Elasticomyces elasticus]KAK4998301.1 hypothetical protein LTR66_002447 [Elasticomyces elasticus]
MRTDSALYKWTDLMLEASRIVGQDLGNASHYGKWMEEAGFENVRSTMYKWPGNHWPKGKKEKWRGLWMMQNHLEGLHGFTMGLFTRIHGWSPEAVEVFLADVRKDIKSTKIHVWWPVYVVYGQKPKIVGDSAG